MWDIVNSRVKMKYKVRLLLSDEGVAASVPGLPGCWSQGRDEQEAFTNIEVAIKEYLAAVEDRSAG